MHGLNYSIFQKNSDEIFELLKKTLDLVFWMESKMLLYYNVETSKALKWFLKDSGSLNRYVPLIVSLISSLT